MRSSLEHKAGSLQHPLHLRARCPQGTDRRERSVDDFDGDDHLFPWHWRLPQQGRFAQAVHGLLQRRALGRHVAPLRPGDPPLTDPGDVGQLEDDRSRYYRLWCS